MMSLLPLIIWIIPLLVQTTNSVLDPAFRLQPVSQRVRLQDTTSCPSCSLAWLRRSGVEEESEVAAQQDMVEAVKRHILNMLHLQNRPNITQPVPRAVLLNALRKLHVGRVAEDGSVHIEEGEEELWGQGSQGGRGRATTLTANRDNGAQETMEIITFAEAGDSPGALKFVLSAEGSAFSLVEQANVWLFLHLAKTNRSRTKVNIRLFQQHHLSNRHSHPAQEDILLAEKNVDTRRSGWHTFSVLAAVQALLKTPEGTTLRLRFTCPLCADSGATLVLVSGGLEMSQRVNQREQSHQPFIMVVVQQEDGADSQRRRKRGLECDGKVQVCCKREFYVNFKDIGWNDWIIAPSGYHANYCEGECPSHVASIAGSTLSFHSTIISHYRMRGYSPFQNLQSCCVPTRLRAMSMLYYNEEQKIIKKDIQNMIVEECGCS